jgi:hypothetical protein
VPCRHVQRRCSVIDRRRRNGQSGLAAGSLAGRTTEAPGCVRGCEAGIARPRASKGLRERPSVSLGRQPYAACSRLRRHGGPLLRGAEGGLEGIGANGLESV